MSSGPGEQSRIYHTSDAGRHWELQFTNGNPKGFFDSIAFWDRKHGVVLGDPIPDESGKLKFEILATDNGKNWRALSTANMPVAEEGEGAFAASNRCLAVLGSVVNNARAHDGNLWFGTGGSVARVFHSGDTGETWQVTNTPMVHGPESAGIFSIAFRDAIHGVMAGGDYKRPEDDGPNLAFTEDGGKTWKLSAVRPQAYFSAVAYERGVSGSAKSGAFIVGQDFILDLQPRHKTRRIPGREAEGLIFNAISAYPGGGALAVGSKGLIAAVH